MKLKTGISIDDKPKHVSKYCLAGAGVRGLCYLKALTDKFTHCADTVAIFDHNRKRAEAFNSYLCKDVKIYSDLDLMVQETKPDIMIICTPDCTHDEFIEAAFKNGMDVIVEKPLTINEEKVRRIEQLKKKYNKKLTVTFNLRYALYMERLKKTVMQEDIGEIKSVSLDWFLDKVHGTEYFRRWHANMANSGGLLVHKSTHHFDIVNWLLDDVPESVMASGSLQIFGKKGEFRGENCRKCEHKSKCPYYYDMSKWDEAGRNKMNKLYFEAEEEDGYIRDNCVFREDIDIYDTMNVIVNYRKGTQMSYTLTAYAPYEGYKMVLTGTKGRIEAQENFGGIMMHSTESVSQIRVIRATNRDDIKIDNVEFETAKGDHGGGDSRIYRCLFEGDVEDPLRQAASFREGAMSCLIGICANQSIQQQRLIKIPELEI